MENSNVCRKCRSVNKQLFREKRLDVYYCIDCVGIVCPCFQCKKNIAIYNCDSPKHWTGFPDPLNILVCHDCYINNDLKLCSQIWQTPNLFPRLTISNDVDVSNV